MENGPSLSFSGLDLRRGQKSSGRLAKLVFLHAYEYYIVYSSQSEAFIHVWGFGVPSLRLIFIELDPSSTTPEAKPPSTIS